MSPFDQIKKINPWNQSRIRQSSLRGSHEDI